MLARDAPVVLPPAAGGGRLDLAPAVVSGLDADRHPPRPGVAGHLPQALDAAPEAPVQRGRRAPDRLEPGPLQARRGVELRPESRKRQPVGQQEPVAHRRPPQADRRRLAHPARPAHAHAGHPAQESRERVVARFERVEVLRRGGEARTRPEQAVAAAHPELDLGGAAEREVAADRDVGDHRDRERGRHHLRRIVDGRVVESGPQPLEPIVAVAVGHRRHHGVGRGEREPQPLDRRADGRRHGSRQRALALRGRGGGGGPADQGESKDAGADSWLIHGRPNSLISIHEPAAKAPATRAAARAHGHGQYDANRRDPAGPVRRAGAAEAGPRRRFRPAEGTHERVERRGGQRIIGGPWRRRRRGAGTRGQYRNRYEIFVKNARLVRMRSVV